MCVEIYFGVGNIDRSVEFDRLALTAATEFRNLAMKKTLGPGGAIADDPSQGLQFRIWPELQKIRCRLSPSFYNPAAPMSPVQ